MSNILKNLTQNTDKTEKQEQKFGSYGYLEIPSLGISVPLNSATSANAQKIVDDPDSAAFIRWGHENLVADHVHQSNFKNLIDAKPGMTKAYIRYSNGQFTKYVCVVSQRGHIMIDANGGNRLYTWNGESAVDKNPEQLTIYTCFGLRKGDKQYVTLTYWEKLT